ncbi:MAG: hypothetical protein V3S17_03915 [candidate division Zixibacteria bacterium]
MSALKTIALPVISLSGNSKIIFVCALLISLVAVASESDASQLISYQGFLEDSLGSPVADSIYELSFELYTDSTAGQRLWLETSQVVTAKGVFVHLLGSINAINDDYFQNYDRLYLQLVISGEPALPRTELVASPFAFSAYNLKTIDNRDSLAIATNSEEHSLSFYDSLGNETIRLSGIDSANESVRLPESAIDYHEILDEPGLTAAINIDQVALFTDAMTDLVTVDITTPADGFILLHGKCYLLLSGTTGPNNALIQIDEDEAGPSEFPYYTIAGLGGYANTATSYFPVYVTRIFFKPAGSYTFRMEGRASFSPPAEAKSWDHILTAVYYPTAYSGVKSLMSTLPLAVEGLPVRINNRTDITENGTYFEVDLRDLQSLQKELNDIGSDSSKNK